VPSLRRGPALVLTGASVLLLSACSESEPEPQATREQTERIVEWLTCDECRDGELAYVVDSVGPAAAPVLEEALVAFPDEYVANIRAAVGLAWSRRTNPLIDSLEYVDRFVANYRATIQARAARALGALGEVAALERAYRERVALELRDDVVAAIESELARLGGGGPGFDPPDVASIVLRPAQFELETGAEAVLEAVPIDENGRVRSVGLTWAVSDPAVIDSVDGDSTWVRVRGVAAGTATVRASLDGVAGESTVTVVPSGPPSGRITIVSGTGQVFARGEPHQPLVVRVEDASGAGVSAALVAFRGTRGTALFEVDALTNSDGEARLDVVAAPSPGVIWIDATVTGVPPSLGLTMQPAVVRFQLRVVEP
jgi:hypothetical protein